VKLIERLAIVSTAFDWYALLHQLEDIAKSWIGFFKVQHTWLIFYSASQTSKGMANENQSGGI
jgi:hypothetical protein